MRLRHGLEVFVTHDQRTSLDAPRFSGSGERVGHSSANRRHVLGLKSTAKFVGTSQISAVRLREPILTVTRLRKRALVSCDDGRTQHVCDRRRCAKKIPARLLLCIQTYIQCALFVRYRLRSATTNYWGDQYAS